MAAASDATTTTAAGDDFQDVIRDATKSLVLAAIKPLVYAKMDERLAILKNGLKEAVSVNTIREVFSPETLEETANAGKLSADDHDALKNAIEVMVRSKVDEMANKLEGNIRDAVLETLVEEVGVVVDYTATIAGNYFREGFKKENKKFVDEAMKNTTEFVIAIGEKFAAAANV
jgi:hypothetical protein